ncbi:HTH-type transcriptional activator IlvY [Persicirhabdus sediminis]|uniref:HTH-type transcriptional activator IlvY n=1 Tax=Persicirhabdus sediminis TaxID=454144 RepID=A0A8J7MG73_9BACT|nr:HTH-type transcriptional activator IlvY [Persicirhabdus sediminis]MBK1792226.1 HTH-type transcriptional activator IlvY [Persicirhabdus sediminis]
MHEELKHFLAVANLLHFGRASQACHLSPSALTRSIQRLEESVGKPLFMRDKRSVSLTPAGEKFKTYALSVVDQWQGLQDQLNQENNIQGSLSIYASITAVYSLLPNLLESYRTAYPQVQIELHTGAEEDSVQEVLTDEIDVAVAALPASQLNKLAFIPLVQTDLVFIAPKTGNLNIDLANKEKLTTTPMVLPRSGLARQRIDQWFKKQRVKPLINSETSGNEALIAMVRLGCGIGVVPELVLDRSPFKDDIRILSQAPQLEPYTVGLCTTQRQLKLPKVAALWELAGIA